MLKNQELEAFSLHQFLDGSESALPQETTLIVATLSSSFLRTDIPSIRGSGLGPGAITAKIYRRQRHSDQFISLVMNSRHKVLTAASTELLLWEH